jgi:hypothetical protein
MDVFLCVSLYLLGVVVVFVVVLSVVVVIVVVGVA